MDRNDTRSGRFLRRITVSAEHLSVCYYHMKYGDETLQCMPPCVFEDDFNERFDNYIKQMEEEADKEAKNSGK